METPPEVLTNSWLSVSLDIPNKREAIVSISLMKDWRILCASYFFSAFHRCLRTQSHFSPRTVVQVIVPARDNAYLSRLKYKEIEGVTLFVSSIDIKEFRGIACCKTLLSFSEFTVLIGRNNSGKSSVLEALSLLPLYTFSLPYSNDSKLGILEKLHGGKSSMVYGYSGHALLTYNVLNRIWTLKVKDDGWAELEIEGIDKDYMRSDMLTAAAKVLAISGGDKMVYDVNSRVFFIPNDTSFMNNLFSKLGEEQNRSMITKMGAHARIARDLVNKCVDDSYTEILFAPELSARKERGDGKSPLYIKLKDLGDGVEKVVLTALWLEAMNPSLVLWDDFEGSAHPTLIKVLLEWLSKKHWQVVISTHSLDVITSLLEVRPKDAKVVQLRKTNDDVLIHEDLTLEELEDLIDTSQDPRKLVDSLKL